MNAAIALQSATDQRTAIVELAASLADRFAPRAAGYDRDNVFPFENFRELHESGYLALSVPTEFGGAGATSSEVAAGQERLAQGCGATALAATMHLGLIGRLADTRVWPEEIFGAICRDVVEHGALINSAHTEPELGSPSRGGLPSTTAVRTVDGWRIDGRKSWASLAPALTYVHLLATLIDGDEPRRRGNFILRMDTPGIRIVETSDSLGMRATASHDLELSAVDVPASALVPSDGSTYPGDGRDWGAFLGQAVFLGVATAARDVAVRYAQERRPNGMDGPIAELQTVQHRIAEIEILLLQARRLMYAIAEEWQSDPSGRDALSWQLAAMKYTVSNNTMRIGDLALRVTGSAGLARALPLERHFRDLRVSVGQPPIDDAALTAIGRHALGLDGKGKA